MVWWLANHFCSCDRSAMFRPCNWKQLCHHSYVI